MPQPPGDTHPLYDRHLPDDLYVGKTGRKDPVLSPLFADLHGVPPTLLLTSTRDILLSDTTTFHRALLQAGVDARLVVFEALPIPSGITSSCLRRRKPWS